MSPFAHLAVSTALSSLIWLQFKSFYAASACLIGGVLWDLDHIPDYIYNYGWQIKTKHFMWSFKNDVLRRIIVFLHSWELIVLTAAAVWLTGRHPVGIGFLSGAVVHLTLDQIFNKHHPLAYFFTYRLYHRFLGRRFYGKEEYRTRLKALKARQTRNLRS